MQNIRRIQNELYVGTKMIHIEAKMHDEYNQYRGWQIPENEDSADEGYHVV